MEMKGSYTIECKWSAWGHRWSWMRFPSDKTHQITITQARIYLRILHQRFSGSTRYRIAKASKYRER